jgi:hypothetical protein
MSRNAKVKFGVKFVGYSAYVIAVRNEREYDYAQLDFVTGGASVHADRGWATATSRVGLTSLVRSLPNHATELRDLVRQRDAHLQDQSAAVGIVADATSDWINLTIGENEVCLAPDTNINKFIRQISSRFTEIEQVLEQAEQIGARIKRRPYSEFIDEIGKTGLARVEGYGFGLFQDRKLIFHPDYQVFFTRPSGPNRVELHRLEPNTKADTRPN